VLGVSLTDDPPEEPELVGTPTEESVGGAADPHPIPATAATAATAATGASLRRATKSERGADS
jgi:hypothetical protein